MKAGTRNVRLLVLLLCAAHVSFAQKSELNISAYSGLFSFRGDGASSRSYITAFIPSDPGIFTANPYGRKSSFSYSVELQGQRITKQNIIYGAGIAFESLKSKVYSDTMSGGDLVYFVQRTDAKTTLKNTFVTVNPFAGYRFSHNNIAVDLVGGLDLAFCLRSVEKGETRPDNENNLSFANKLSKPALDVRPRIHCRIAYKKVGINAGYSLGLVNFQNHYYPKAFTSFLRLGLTYRVK